MEDLKKNFEREKKIADEIRDLTYELRNSRDPEEKALIRSQINSLKRSMRKAGRQVLTSTEKISMPKPLNYIPPEKVQSQQANLFSERDTFPGPELELSTSKTKGKSGPKKKEEKPTPLERLTLKRMKKKKEKVVKRKERTPSTYVKLASDMFSKSSLRLLKRGKFDTLRRDLIRANLEFVPANYISVVFFTTFISIFIGIFATLFFLFFNLVATPPFVVPMEDSFGARFLKVFWIMFLVPAVVFIFTYYFPSLEKKSIEGKINSELPFAAIHMSSISSSMLEPSKIFSIIIATEEYPHLSKEFTKLLNEVNIYGYDLVTSLRNMSFNSPSRKLAELYNGLATTINSGGNLPEFFEKRSQTLLFDHRLEREKQSKAAETFMDIYISVVIAAPMILMLLLMMMRVSGLGITLSPSMITLVMSLGVVMVNLAFLTFLHLKQPTNA
jgi:flagellar protein FlaJ